MSGMRAMFPCITVIILTIVCLDSMGLDVCILQTAQWEADVSGRAVDCEGK